MAATGFQTWVGVQPAPGVEGDFCTANPRYTVLAGPGGFIAGDEGVTIGHFCWVQADPVDPNAGPKIATNTGSGPIAGFIHREQQGTINRFTGNIMDIAGMTIPKGIMVTIMNAGDFWVRNGGSGPVNVGDRCFASHADGHAEFGSGDEETLWYAMSGGQAGDLVKITSWPPFGPGAAPPALVT